MQGDLRWGYVAEGADGKVIRGDVFAPDQAAAVRIIKAQRLNPVTIKEARSNSSFLKIQLFSERKSLAAIDLVEFSRSFADLLNAGVPAGKALGLLSTQLTKKSLQPFLKHLSDRVRAGQLLSAALESAEQKPPRLMIAITAAGENTGKLAEQFTMLSEHYEAQLKLRRELVAQLVYPAALLVLIFLTIAFLSHFVLPQFQTIFANADATPPPETRLVMAAGEWIRSNAALFPVMMLVGLLGGRFIINQYRSFCEKFLLSLPIIGNHWRKMIAGQFCRSLGALVVGGASMSTALAIARQTVSIELLRDKYEAAANEVRSGVSFSKAVEKENLFPDSIMGFARLGEESGTLGAMLLKAADRCEQDVKASLTKCTSLVSPIMTALMGLLTAGVIASVMSGVLSLNETVY